MIPGAFFGVRAYLRTAAGKMSVDTTLLKFPAVGAIVRSFAVARIARVLGVLLLHANQPVDREQIIEGAWGGKPPRSAVNLVQKYVGDVRRSLDLDDGSAPGYRRAVGQ